MHTTTRTPPLTVRHLDGTLCLTPTAAADCPRGRVCTDESIAHINQLVTTVATLLPFPVELTADMGGTFTLQIDLGTPGGVDDPHDTAGIDPDSPTTPHWWINTNGGDTVIVSDLTLAASPGDVAAWITTTARETGSPATIDTASSASCQHYIDTGHYLRYGESDLAGTNA